MTKWYSGSLQPTERISSVIIKEKSSSNFLEFGGKYTMVNMDNISNEFLNPGFEVLPGEYNFVLKFGSQLYKNYKLVTVPGTNYYIKISDDSACIQILSKKYNYKIYDTVQKCLEKDILGLYSIPSDTADVGTSKLFFNKSALKSIFGDMNISKAFSANATPRLYKIDSLWGSNDAGRYFMYNIHNVFSGSEPFDVLLKPGIHKLLVGYKASFSNGTFFGDPKELVYSFEKGKSYTINIIMHRKGMQGWDLDDWKAEIIEIRK
jgi:hypothetical protein